MPRLWKSSAKIVKVGCPHCGMEFDEDDAVVADWPPTVDNSLVERVAVDVWKDGGMATPWESTSETYREGCRQIVRLVLSSSRQHVVRRPVETSVIDRVANEGQHAVSGLPPVTLVERVAKAVYAAGNEFSSRPVDTDWRHLDEDQRNRYRVAAITVINAVRGTK